MSMPVAVHVEVTSPLRFDRTALFVRILLSIVLGWLGITAGWLVCLLYLALPLIAAISIMSIGAARFGTEVAPRITRVLTWLLRLSAFMVMLTDRFPTGEPDVHVEMPYTAQPTATTALVRLVSSIPSGLVLMVLWFVSSVLWVIAAVLVLLGLSMPRSILAYQRGVVRWQARLVAYHASLVDEYPPYHVDTGEVDHELAAEAR